MPEAIARPPADVVRVLAVLVDNHRTFLRFLEGRVGSRAVAEDIVQEAFVRGGFEPSPMIAASSGTVVFEGSNDVSHTVYYELDYCPFSGCSSAAEARASSS